MTTTDLDYSANMAQHASDVDGMKDAKERYILANDFEEIDRMSYQHKWVKGSSGGLIKAPIDLTRENLRILDSATADGIWLSDVSALVPKSAQLVGFDIAPELFLAADVRPVNVDLSTQDLFKPLPAAWQASFDLVHQRFILPSFQDADLEAALTQLVSAVKPGGWLQLVEPDARARVSDPRAKAFEMLHRVSEHLMPNPNATPQAISCLEKLGMLDIRHEAIDMPVGKAHPDRNVGECGRRNFCTVLRRYMEACSAADFGVPTSEWDDLPEQLASDTLQHDTAMRVNFVWARKATEGAEV